MNSSQTGLPSPSPLPLPVGSRILGGEPNVAQQDRQPPSHGTCSSPNNPATLRALLGARQGREGTRREKRQDLSSGQGLDSAGLGGQGMPGRGTSGLDNLRREGAFHASSQGSPGCGRLLPALSQVLSRPGEKRVFLSGAGQRGPTRWLRWRGGRGTGLLTS